MLIMLIYKHRISSLGHTRLALHDLYSWIQAFFSTLLILNISIQQWNNICNKQTQILPNALCCDVLMFFFSQYKQLRDPICLIPCQ